MKNRTRSQIVTFMKIYFRAIILASCIGVLSNCNDLSNNQKQQDAIQYYNEISKVTGDVDKQTTNLTGYLRAVAPLAKADPNYQLSPNKIDSFERFYSSFSSSVSRSKSKLKQLGEFNENWNMASLLIANYEIIQKGYDSTFPVYLKVYVIGWLKASSSERETIMDASKILKRTFELTRAKTDSFGLDDGICQKI